MSPKSRKNKPKSSSLTLLLFTNIFSQQRSLFYNAQSLSAALESLLQAVVLVGGKSSVLNAVVAASVGHGTSAVDPRGQRDAVVRKTRDRDSYFVLDQVQRPGESALTYYQQGFL